MTEPKKMELRPRVDTDETVFRFMETQCAEWDVPGSVIKAAAGAINNIAEVAPYFAPKQSLVLEVSHEGRSLVVNISWTGKPFVFPDVCPPLDGDKEDVIGISAHLVRQSADSVAFQVNGDKVTLYLHYRH